MTVAVLGRVLLPVIACTACGRIGFAPTVSGDTGEHGFRRSIEIDNQASLAPLPTGYTVRVALADVIADGHAMPDLSDLRVLAPSAEGSEPGLDRTIDQSPPGESSALWFALPAPIAAGASAQYWLYYGRSDPSPPTDPARVFPLFDAFDGAAVASTWQTFGAPTVAAGVLVLAAGDNAVTTVPAADDIGATSVLEVRMSITNPTMVSNYFWIGYQHEGGFGTGAPFQNWVGEGAAIHGWVNSMLNRRCPDLVPDVAPHTYRIEREPTRTRYFLDGASVCDVDLDDPTDYSIQLRNQSPATEIRIDWIRVRNRNVPEPSVVLGPEEGA